MGLGNEMLFKWSDDLESWYAAFGYSSSTKFVQMMPLE